MHQKVKEMDPKKMINGTTQGSNKTKSQPLGVKKILCKYIPTQVAIGLIATTYSFWYTHLRSLGCISSSQQLVVVHTLHYITYSCAAI
jgi:hypothetical protein